MSKAQSATAGLLVVIAALLAANVIGQAPKPAGVEPCPSDVDDDGVVGVLDFLQVLATWGPCPNPPRVTDTTSYSAYVFRLWSDGTVEWRWVQRTGDCSSEDCPGGDWQLLSGPSPHAQEASATAITSQSGGALIRLWSDGFAEVAVFAGNSLDQCNPGLTFCKDWAPLP